MEDENTIQSKSIVKKNSKKLTKLLEIAQKKYETLLSLALKGSKKSYLKGKMEILKRVQADLEKKNYSTQAGFRAYLMGQAFTDIPKSKIIQLIVQSDFSNLFPRRINSTKCDRKSCGNQLYGKFR